MTGKRIIAAAGICAMIAAYLPAYAEMPPAAFPAAGAELAEQYTPEEYFEFENGFINGYTGTDTVVNIPPEIGGQAVTGIGRSAFRSGSLTSITIPDSVTEIGSDAFSDCSSLESISVSEGNQDYSSQDGVLFNKDKTKLVMFPTGKKNTEYIIPDGVREIGDSAFYDCTGLGSITIPDGVTEIGRGAFNSCTSLVSITIPDSVTKIGSDVFYRCSNLTDIAIPAGVTEIGDSAFSGCSSLTDITIPDSVTKIGSDAFSGCSSLTDITIPDGVTKIGGGAFSGCSSLRCIVVPESVTEIGDYLFSGCSGLVSVTLPGSITEIDSYMLEGCKSLESISISEKNQNYSSEDGVLFNKDKTLLILYPKGRRDAEYIIPDGVTEIEEGAFSGRSSLTDITIPDSVTKIGRFAFSDCRILENITMPDSVTEIGEGAFSYCRSLRSIEVPNGVTELYSLFEGCYNLEAVTIPDSVSAIDDAFSDCRNLESISVSEGNNYYCSEDGVLFNKDKTKLILYPEGKRDAEFIIPDSVTEIDGGAFYVCNSLESISVSEGNQNYSSEDGVLFNKDKTILILYPEGKRDAEYVIPDSVTEIDGGAFYGCGGLTSITIPDGITEIGSSAFSGCGGLTSITIPDGITEIGSSAFSGCSSLTSITIPDSVTIIGESAFRNCSSLKEITIPDGVTEIGDSAFSGCSSLTGITIPDGVTEIDRYEFRNCSSLTDITISDSVTMIGKGAFEGCSSLESISVSEKNQNYSSEDGVLFDKDKTILILYPGRKRDAEYVIPDGVTEIGSYAFEGCSGLESITIPDSVTEIGGSAFEGCSSLESITIPDSVMRIGSYAFRNCTGLTDITIPDSVTKIGSGAFRGCTGLTDITIPDSVTDISTFAFEDCSSLETVNVSEGNENYSSQDGVLFNKNKTKLVLFPAGKKNIEYIIPDGVKEISDLAFLNCSGLTGITIPDGVTKIGEGAFSGCSSLTDITIPDSVTKIHRFAFDYDCGNLKSISVSEGNRCYSSQDGILYNKNKTELIKYMSKEAESEFIIPETVTVVRSNAFDGSGGNVSITLPGSVTYLDDEEYPYWSGLTGINVSENNEYYRSEDGVLFNKDKTMLMKYPDARAASEYTVPDSVRYIGTRAFSDCSDLTSITIPQGVRYIDQYAFYECTNLKSLTLPESVRYIDYGAFSGCEALTDVYYSGTEKDKRRLFTEEYDENEPLLNAVWHYSGAEPMPELISIRADAVSGGEGTLLVSAELSSYADGELIAAKYDGEGRLILAQSRDTQPGRLSYTFGFADSDNSSIKVFLWDKSNNRYLSEAARAR